jgi:hypothetical protein
VHAFGIRAGGSCAQGGEFMADDEIRERQASSGDSP